MPGNCEDQPYSQACTMPSDVDMKKTRNRQNKDQTATDDDVELKVFRQQRCAAELICYCGTYIMCA